MKKYPITYWMGVPKKFLYAADGEIDRSRYEEMKEAGFNLIDAMHRPEENKKILEIAEDLGLEVQVHDRRMEKVVFYEANREELVKSIVADYKDYPALHSYHMIDEPSEKLFDDLAAVNKLLHDLDPVHEGYINLLPNYATAEQLGHATYEEHLEDFITRVKPEIVSYDHYNLFKHGAMPVPVVVDNERERMILESAFNKQERPGFYDNFETVRKVCVKHGVPYMIIVLVVEHGPYRNLTEAEIRWEVFQSLAYGSSRICYFTYWTPGIDGADDDINWNWQNGMISKEGERLPHYDMVKNVNRELSAMGDLLVGKKCLDVFHSKDAPETMTKLFAGYGNVEKIDGDAVVAGFYEDNITVLANRSYKKEANITLTCKAGTTFEVLDTESGEWIALCSENNTYAICLEPGDGIMVKVN